jgi:hypothetical protein
MHVQFDYNKISIEYHISFKMPRKNACEIKVCCEIQMFSNQCQIGPRKIKGSLYISWKQPLVIKHYKYFIIQIDQTINGAS